MKKIISFMLIVSIAALLLPCFVFASTEADLIGLLNARTSEAVLKTYYSDFNYDGQFEMFAVTGAEENDSFDIALAVGNVWYVSKDGVKNLTKDTNIGVGIILSGDQEPACLYMKNEIRFKFINMWGNGQTVTYVCRVSDPGEVETTVFGGSLMYGDNGWYVATSDYDILIQKKEFGQGLISGMGRSWKNYWYFFEDSSNQFKEYGGIEITTGQFLQFDGASDILDMIREGQIYNILYRGNGIININIFEEDSMFENDDAYRFSNILVGYDATSVWVINGYSWDGSPINDGLYLPALVPDMAVYPEFKSPLANYGDNVSVVVNGGYLAFDQPPVIMNGRTLVPLRAIFEALGAAVEWNGDTETVTASKGGTEVKITVGENKLYKNGGLIELDASALIINNRTLVPVRAISEALGCKVDWDGTSRTVYIENK